MDLSIRTLVDMYSNSTKKEMWIHYSVNRDICFEYFRYNNSEFVFW